jgi:hypothetical protein
MGQTCGCAAKDDKEFEIVKHEGAPDEDVS